MRYLVRGHKWAVRVGEIEGAWHGLEADGVVVHVQWCEGCWAWAFIFRPSGGRLDGVKNL